MEIGEVRKAKEVGIKSNGDAIYTACPTCGYTRWLTRYTIKTGHIYCKKCANKTRAERNHSKFTSPVKTASELGLTGRSTFIEQPCSSCGINRYVKTSNSYSNKHQVCINCAAKKRALNYRRNGKNMTVDGYIKCIVYQEHPYFNMAGKSGKVHFILEHRLVMAQSLGRCLEKWEIVHHINGIKNDNRIENLELLPNNAPNVMYSKADKQIKELENKVSELEIEVKLLKFQNKELQQANPELNPELNW